MSKISTGGEQLLVINGWVSFIRKQAPIGIHNKPEPARQDEAVLPKKLEMFMKKLEVLEKLWTN